MPLSDTPPTLAGLVDELVCAAQPPALLQLFKTNPMLRERKTLLQLADSVNRIAREDLERAERLSDAVCYLADLLDDNFCRARTGRAAGNIQVLRGQYGRALGIFDTSLGLFQKIGEELEQAATLSSSLQPLIYLGRYNEAFEKARQAQDIAERYNDELLLARLEVNFGNIFHRQDRFLEAVKHYESAFATLEGLQQYRDCAVAAINLAVCYISLNDFRQAESAYKKAREISEREGMPMLVAQADYNIAYLHYYRGEHNLAIHLFQQTRLYCERVGDQYHGALCDLDQSELYLELHLNGESTELAQQALASFEKMGMAYEAAKSLVFLGVAAYQDRKPFRALELFTTAQECMAREQNLPWVAAINFYQALILQQEGRFYEALRYCKGAQSFYSRSPGSGKSVLVQLLRATLHLDIGEVKESASWSDQAVSCAERINSPSLLAHAYRIRGRVAESCGAAPHESFDWYLKSLSSLEAAPSRLGADELKIPFSKNHPGIYEAMVTLAPPGEGSSDGNVFELIEKAKSRELAEQLAFRSDKVTSPQKGRSALAEQVNALREELSWYYHRIQDMELQKNLNGVAPDPQKLHLAIREREDSLAKTLDELHITDEEFHSIQTASFVPIERIRGALGADEIILEYHQARGSMYVCLISREIIHVARLTTVEKLRVLLQTLETQFSKYRLGQDYVRRFSAMLSETMTNALATLHAELIGPLSSFLTGKRLIVIPDGFLNYLPFHALFDGRSYLGDRYKISYSGSASAYFMAVKKQRGHYDQDLILSSETGSTSPGTAQRIAAVLPESKVVPASAKMLSAHGPGSRFIHVDSVMLPHPNSGVLSTLLLGDERITLLDTFNLRLPCSLVCLTGTAPGIRSSGNGEEINLLARGFEYAGAQSVLMPLWNSGDEATASFLETFYRLADSESDKALALQKAMFTIKDRFTSPFYWAPYILRGATGRS